GPVRVEGDKPFSGPAGSDGSTGTSAGSTEDEDGQGLLAGAVAYEPDGEFTVQVGVYSDVLKAAERVTELSALGYPAYVIAQPDGKGFRVRIGYFGTREDARAFGDIFSEDHGSDFWIDRRVNEL
ncbi:MAG: SPOR domain-containing protein, partial [Gemmatimonadetes bacterium]|nr:SPOR domain-containing protein [Gemmatimonadota bacterium]